MVPQCTRFKRAVARVCWAPLFSLLLPEPPGNQALPLVHIEKHPGELVEKICDCSVRTGFSLDLS
jgi:hypothetical protein